MKKLLSLTSCFSVLLFLLSCPKREPKVSSGDATSVIVSGDSLIASTEVTCDTNRISRDDKIRRDTTLHRVEHGTSDQQKLDSIKNAKAKLKKKN